VHRQAQRARACGAAHSLAAFAALDEARLLGVVLAQSLKVVALPNDLVVCERGRRTAESFTPPMISQVCGHDWHTAESFTLPNDLTSLWA